MPSVLSCWRRWSLNFLGFLEKRRHHKCLHCLHGGTYGEVERWSAAMREYVSKGCTSSITSLPQPRMPQGNRVQALCPHSLLPASFPSDILGDEKSWICRDDLKGQPGDDIKLCCFCFLSQLSWLVPLFASKPRAASPVVSIQALKLFKLFAERCSPSVSSNHAWTTPVKMQPQY